MDAIELHHRTVAVFLDRVSAVPAAAWGGPTPCTDWDVSQLVNHVVGEDRWTAPLLAGQTIAEVGDRFDGDLLGADPKPAAAAAGAEAIRAATKADVGGTVHLSYGDEVVGEYLHQLAADHLIHAWDLAAATGGDRTLDPELVDAIGTWFAERRPLYRGAGIIADPVDVPEDADSTSRLIAAFGRDPGWQPHHA